MHAGYLGGVWAAVKAGMGAGTIALLTLYTDYPEVDGLLTSLSSVVFTVAVAASMVVVMFVAVEVDRNAKRGLPGRGIQEAFLR